MRGDIEKFVKTLIDLDDNKTAYCPLGEDAAAEVLCYNDYLFLFEIPPYGGEPRFVEAYPQKFLDVKKLIEEIKRWT